MIIKIKKMDGPARICELSDKQNKVKTPNIFFLKSKRFIKPNSAKFLLEEEINNLKKNNYVELIKIQKEKLNNNIFLDIPILNNLDYNYQVVFCEEDIDKISNNNENNFVIIGNAIHNSKNQKNFVKNIIKLRKNIGHKNLIYLPTIGNISNLSLFSYMGIDLFDCISAIISARKKELFFQFGSQKISELKQIPCNCKFCSDYKTEPDLMPFEKILKHNYEMLLNEIINIKNHIYNGSLRKLVELRVKTNVNSTALLKILDNNHYKYIEENTPLINNNKLVVTSKESYNRPEIRRFQERIISEYKKPDCTKILLILPCSAKKPYSFSKSHRKFREIILKQKNHHIIHEIIITSPIGIVPRELELVYPASNYDIPVTGEWDSNEKSIISNLLQRYLLKNEYDKIILHLPNNIIKCVSDSVKNSIKTEVSGSVTSDKSLKSLHDVLNNECESFSSVNPEKRKLENIESILSYQFNNYIAKTLLKDCKIKGRYPYQKIYNKNFQLGMITKERGLITITIEGAKKIYNFNKNIVEIYDDFLLKGSLLAPGIKKADINIRIGDDVFILKNKKLCGVGIAKMNGEKMMNLSYGEAVSIRHKV